MSGLVGEFVGLVGGFVGVSLRGVESGVFYSGRWECGYLVGLVVGLGFIDCYASWVAAV